MVVIPMEILFVFESNLHEGSIKDVPPLPASCGGCHRIETSKHDAVPIPSLEGLGIAVVMNTFSASGNAESINAMNCSRCTAKVL